MSIKVHIASESRFPVNRKKMRTTVRQMIKRSGFRGSCYVEVCIVGSRKMRHLNKVYCGIDKTTPVLTFALEDVHQACQQTRVTYFVETKTGKSFRQRAFALPPDGILRLGSIVISFPEARILAAQDGVLIDEEIEKLIKHGMEHLLGIEQ